MMNITNSLGKKLNVQSVVEQPEIYIMAKCADTIAEKLSYVKVMMLLK